jgi:translation initiation factor 5B
MAVLVGLAQQYLVKRLERRTDGPARGIVLEVKEEMGLGPSANVILLDGTLHHGDNIVFGKRDGAVLTKIKALLLPKPLDEMRDPRDKFKPVSEVMAAAGLKITSSELEGALAGSPVYVYDQKKGEEELVRLKTLVEAEIKNAIVSNAETTGIILKCDAIGSLEAITDLLKKANVPIRMADIGNITRRDVVEAAAVKENDRYLGVVLGFSVKVLDDAQKESQDREIKIFNEQIIYNLVRSYTDWVAYQREHEESILFNELPPVCKFQFLKGFVFRRNDPAVFGAEIQVGKLKQKVQVVNEEGKKVGTVHQIQDSGKAIEEATVGMQIAVSIKEPTIGRQINEGDIFYTDINSRQAKQLLDRFNHRLNEKEKEILSMLVAMKRKNDPTFAYL